MVQIRRLVQQVAEKDQLGVALGHRGHPHVARSCYQAAHARSRVEQRGRLALAAPRFSSLVVALVINLIVNLVVLLCAILIPIPSAAPFLFLGLGRTSRSCIVLSGTIMVFRVFDEGEKQLGQELHHRLQVSAQPVLLWPILPPPMLSLLPGPGKVEAVAAARTHI